MEVMKRQCDLPGSNTKKRVAKFAPIDESVRARTGVEACDGVSVDSPAASLAGSLSAFSLLYVETLMIGGAVSTVAACTWPAVLLADSTAVAFSLMVAFAGELVEFTLE
jgi:hypothetical protein